MATKPTKAVFVLLPIDVYEKIKALADEAGWPLSRYLRQMVRRYLRHVEGDDRGGEEDWKI